jgi:cyanate lyase
MIELTDLTQTLFAAKRKKGLSFADLERVLNRDEVWIAAVFYQQAAMSEDEAKLLTEALGLGGIYIEQLTAYPTKGLGPVVPTDPFVYRFYEIIQVYGLPLKSVIQEKFGDGIMSAIDFTMDVEKEVDPHGDRVKLTMSGKFLSYKKW